MIQDFESNLATQQWTGGVFSVRRLVQNGKVFSHIFRIVGSDGEVLQGRAGQGREGFLQFSLLRAGTGEGVCSTIIILQSFRYYLV